MTINELLIDRVFKIFYQISHIPHGSYNEAAISDWLVQWAKERDFYVEQDHLKNVLIRRPASKGYEKTKGILLQAHMDMVCEKILTSDHDFERDSIKWVIDGDWLSTGGETTLGADDGIGMALAMALLEEDFVHPPMEVLFTVAEEEDMSGAIGFDAAKLEAVYVVNIDHVNDTEILCGSCGGKCIEAELPVKWAELPDKWNTYQLKVSGLKGGHSGEDIHRGHGNAISLLARMIMEMEKHTELKLCSMNAGTFRLAIPRDAECVIAIPFSKETEVMEMVASYGKEIKNEYQSAGNDIQFVLCESKDSYDRAAKADPFINLMLLSPNGIREMSADIENLVNTSINLGEFYLYENGYKAIYEVRSAYDSARDFTGEVVERLVTMLGGTIKMHSAYPCWEYRPSSELRKIAEKIFTETNGSAPKSYAVHAGLECGCFFETRPDLDAISVGPNCVGLHSPEERLSISSTKKMYGMLQKLVREVCLEEK